MKLLDGLKAIRDDGPTDNQFGICSNLNFVCGRMGVDAALEAAFRCWPKYSGNIEYPVPAPDGLSGEEEYVTRQKNRMSMWTGKYGDLRRELLDHCIEYFSAVKD